jgi:NADP-dependent 3-hydroxy acid dehydrogenase YdfG
MAGLLDGKSALITGGGGGIGRAAALAFAREGARVAVADVAAEAARETVTLINAAGGQAISLAGDVTSDAQVQAITAGAVTAYGRLDCAFNNAGIAGWQVDAAGKKTADWSEEAFDRMIAVNLKGVWLCMKHELVQMQAQGGGAIVNTASIAGLVGLPTSSAYVAAKHAVVGLTKTAAIEYAEAGIRGERGVSRLYQDPDDRGDDAPPRRGDSGAGSGQTHGQPRRDRRDGRVAVLRARELCDRRRLQCRRRVDGGVSAILDDTVEWVICENMKNITVSLDEETYRRARMIAAQQDTSVSALVKRFLQELGSGESEAERLKRQERALRERIATFRGSDRLPRTSVHDRGL